MALSDLTYTNDVCRLVLTKPLSAATTGVAVTSGTPSSLTDSQLPSPTYWLDLAGTASLPSNYVVSRSTVGTYYDSNGFLKTAAANVPRFHYNPETKECLGLLVERSATNYITDSRMTSVAADPFAVGTGGVTKNYMSSQTTPDGLVSSNPILRLTPTLTNSIKYMLRSEFWGASQVSVFSAFFKLSSATAVYPSLIMDDAVNGGVFARFDLVNGTVLQGQATNANATYISSGIEKLPNGWARCWVCGIPSSGSNGRASVTIRNATNTTNGYDPAYTPASVFDGVYVLWPQIEKAVLVPRPTSYIPSNGSFYIRAVEGIQLPAATWINPEQGTFLVEYQKSFSGNFRGYNHPLSVFDAAVPGNNYMSFYNIENTSVITNYTMRTNGVDQVDYVQATVNQGLNKAVQTYKQNEVIFVVNGVHAGTDFSVNVPTLNSIRIGTDYAGNQGLNDCVSRIIYYPIAISREQAIQITNPALF